jgi:hypothetical protein
MPRARQGPLGSVACPPLPRTFCSSVRVLETPPERAWREMLLFSVCLWAEKKVVDALLPELFHRTFPVLNVVICGVQQKSTNTWAPPPLDT